MTKFVAQICAIADHAIVAATIDPDHERPIFGDADRVPYLSRGIDEKLPTLPAQNRHALNERDLTVIDA